MNLSDLHDHFAQVFADNPQKATLAQMAVAELRSALARLAALGHRFALVPHDAVAPPPQAYPKMVFNGSDGPTGHRLVHDPAEEAEAAADGWLPRGVDPALPEPPIEPPLEAPMVSFPIPQEPAPPEGA